MEIEKDLQYYRNIKKEIISHERSFDKDTLPRVERTIPALELLKLKEQGKVIITPCTVGDSVKTKYGDTWRVDGFTTYGEEVRVWCEGENEHYVEFSQDEIIKYIPKEAKRESRCN